MLVTILALVSTLLLIVFVLTMDQSLNETCWNFREDEISWCVTKDTCEDELSPKTNLNDAALLAEESTQEIQNEQIQSEEKVESCSTNVDNLEADQQQCSNSIVDTQPISKDDNDLVFEESLKEKTINESVYSNIDEMIPSTSIVVDVIGSIASVINQKEESEQKQEKETLFDESIHSKVNDIISDQSVLAQSVVGAQIDVQLETIERSNSEVAKLSATLEAQDEIHLPVAQSIATDFPEVKACETLIEAHNVFDKSTDSETFASKLSIGKYQQMDILVDIENDSKNELACFESQTNLIQLDQSKLAENQSVLKESECIQINSAEIDLLTLEIPSVIDEPSNQIEGNLDGEQNIESIDLLIQATPLKLEPAESVVAVDDLLDMDIDILPSGIAINPSPIDLLSETFDQKNLSINSMRPSTAAPCGPLIDDGEAESAKSTQPNDVDRKDQCLQLISLSFTKTTTTTTKDINLASSEAEENTIDVCVEDNLILKPEAELVGNFINSTSVAAEEESNLSNKCVGDFGINLLDTSLSALVAANTEHPNVKDGLAVIPAGQQPVENLIDLGHNKNDVAHLGNDLLQENSLQQMENENELSDSLIDLDHAPDLLEEFNIGFEEANLISPGSTPPVLKKKRTNEQLVDSEGKFLSESRIPVPASLRAPLNTVNGNTEEKDRRIALSKPLCQVSSGLGSRLKPPTKLKKTHSKPPAGFGLQTNIPVKSKLPAKIESKTATTLPSRLPTFLKRNH